MAGKTSSSSDAASKPAAFADVYHEIAGEANEGKSNQPAATRGSEIASESADANLSPAQLFSAAFLPAGSNPGALGVTASARGSAKSIAPDAAGKAASKNISRKGKNSADSAAIPVATGLAEVAAPPPRLTLSWPLTVATDPTPGTTASAESGETPLADIDPARVATSTTTRRSANESAFLRGDGAAQSSPTPLPTDLEPLPTAARMSTANDASTAPLAFEMKLSPSHLHATGSAAAPALPVSAASHPTSIQPRQPEPDQHAAQTKGGNAALREREPQERTSNSRLTAIDSSHARSSAAADSEPQAPTANLVTPAANLQAAAPPTAVAPAPTPAPQAVSEPPATVPPPPAQAATHTEPPAPVPQPPAAANDIHLELPTSTGKVDVRVVDRGGDVHVAVRTADNHLAGNLREGLPALSARLEESGFRSDSWRPAAESERRVETPAAGRALASDAQPGDPQRGRQQQQQPQQQNSRPASSRQVSPSERNNFAWLFTSIR